MIQPFDEGGPYDKRYDETFKPAIEAAGLEAYRIDKDPKVDVPIEDIEQGIANSVACLADISTNNPNVWYELGYAMAKDRVVVLICSDERKDGYPFDVRHRKIIKYSTKSESGYKDLKRAIQKHLKERYPKMQQVAKPAEATAIPQSSDLQEHEIKGLATVGGVVDQALLESEFHDQMMSTGFQGHAASVAGQSLLENGFLEEDWSPNRERLLRVTQKGMRVLSELMDRGELPLRAENPPPRPARRPDLANDLPF